MKKLKLFPKTFIYTFSTFGIIILFAHLLIYFIFPKIYFNASINSLNNKADKIVEILDGKSEDDIRSFLKLNSEAADIKSYISENKNNKGIKIEDNKVIDKTSNSNSIFIEDREIKTKDGKLLNIQFVSSQDLTNDAKELSLEFLPYTILISLIISAIVSLIYTKIILSPIYEIKKVTNKMIKLDKNIRLNVNGNDEINELKNQINILYINLINVIEDLEQKNKEIINSEKMKINFLRSTSHELKTPLASLSIILENMLYKIGDYKNHDKYINKSLEIVNKLSKMIVEINSLSMLQDMSKEKELINIKDDILRLINDYKLLIEEKNIKLNNSIQDEKIFLTKPSLDKILSNIISNAVKNCSENGEILIYSEIYNNKKFLFIENEGKRLADEEIDNSFSLFYTKDSINGNGLGLYTVKTLLENNNLDYIFERTSIGMRFGIEIE